MLGFSLLACLLFGTCPIVGAEPVDEESIPNEAELINEEKMEIENLPNEAEMISDEKVKEGDRAQLDAAAYQQEVVKLVNAERQKTGLKPLASNANLMKVAQTKAEEMATRGYFSHYSPTYGSPFDMMKKFGISYTSAGENIALGQTTPAAVMKTWMGSAGHRANILGKNYTDMGVGVAKDKNGRTYWVQMFIGK